MWIGLVSWRQNWMTMRQGRAVFSDLGIVHDRLLHNRGDLQLLFRRHVGLRSGIKIAVVKLGASLLSFLVVGGCSPTGAVLGRARNAVVDLEALELLPAFPSQRAWPAARPQRESLQLSRFAVP